MTVNTIVQYYKTFCTNHLQIKEFTYMVPKDRFVTNNYKFPLVLIEPLDFTFATGEIQFKHNLYFIDKVNKDLSNYLSVISTQIQLGNDLYTYFTDNEEDFNFFLYNDAPAIPILQDEFEDWVCGICLPLNAQIQNPRDETQIPIIPKVVQE
jgi:hypothetical protein